MNKTAQELLMELPTPVLHGLQRALDIAVQELGAHTTIRQVMALIAVAIANKAERPVGVRDIDYALGDLTSGSASKLLRSMMHIETERKSGVANTIRAERDPKDLRKWDLFITTKGLQSLLKIVQALEERVEQRN